MKLYEKLTEALKTLSASGAPIALAGGFAYAVYSEPRATTDIDMLSLVADDTAFESIGKLFPGSIPHKDTFSFGLVSIRRIAWPSEDDALVFDILTVRDDYFRAQIAQRATTIQFLGAAQRIISREDLYILKQYANRPRDIEDCAALEKAGDFDRTYVNAMIQHLQDAGLWRHS